MGDRKCQLNLKDGPAPSAHRRKHWGSALASRAAPDRSQTGFDADAWMAVVEEQKLTIARAAGVDPSKVRIQIGH